MTVGGPPSDGTPAELVNTARRAHARLARARRAEGVALRALEAALRAAYVANPGLGPTALARQIGVSEGTLRGYTRDLARERRRASSE